MTGLRKPATGQVVRTKGGPVASVVMDRTLGFSVSSAQSVLSKSLLEVGGRVMGRAQQPQEARLKRSP